MSADARVVCVGLATLDVIVALDRLPERDERLPASDGTIAGGGPAATAAVALARLGVPVAFAGVVGDDDVGRFVRAGLSADGVDVRSLAAVPGRSPFTVVLDEGAGGRRLVPSAGSVPGPGLVGDLARACADAAWVHVDHVGWPVVPALRAAGVTTRVSVDGGNPIEGLDLRAVALYAPTERELLRRDGGHELGAAMARALDEGAEAVVATRGAAGAVAAERTRDGIATHRAAALSVEVVSTLGAGDVFHGALLAAILDGQPLPDALAFATAAASLSCRALDGRSGIPTRAEVLAVRRGEVSA